METYQEKIEKTKSVLREAETKFAPNDIFIAWKGGKDTTTMMAILRSLNKGQVPYRVFFNDTTLEFPQTYEFIQKVTNLWGLDLIVERPTEVELTEYNNAPDDSKKELARLMKIAAINRAVEKYSIQAFMLGIRRDENPARQNETYFSPRETHTRIHPLLHFKESDVWKYIKEYDVPYSPLYDHGYRSVGEMPFTSKSTGDERSGRDQDKESQMEKLRSLGYW